MAPRFSNVPAQGVGVGQIAVMGDGQGHPAVGDQKRLGIFQHGRAGGGVAHMADGHIPLQSGQLLFVKHIRHQTHALVFPDPGAVGNDDAGALLAPVLQGVQSEISQLGGLRVSEDPENAAFLFQLTVGK